MKAADYPDFPTPRVKKLIDPVVKPSLGGWAVLASDPSSGKMVELWKHSGWGDQCYQERVPTKVPLAWFPTRREARRYMLRTFKAKVVKTTPVYRGRTWCSPGYRIGYRRTWELGAVTLPLYIREDRKRVKCHTSTRSEETQSTSMEVNQSALGN